MGCSSCGGGRTTPRYSNTPGGNDHPMPGQGMWTVVYPNGRKDEFTHMWQANAAQSTGGGVVYPPGTYKEGSTES